MLKKFSITLIALSTIIYGSLFFMAKHYNTSFFDEIVMQLNRIVCSLNKKQEIQTSKTILKLILKNEHPPANWDNLIVHNPEDDNKDLFYFYKIWTIKTKLTIKDIDGSYPIFQSRGNNVTLINMRYGKEKPVLQFPFSKDKKGNLITGLFFPINERPMSADYNKDNKVNYEDVLIARKIK